MARIITLKKLESGTSICVELDDLLEMFKRAADEKGVNITAATVAQKKEVLKGMGYEQYFDILRKEAEFQWL